MSYKNFHSTYWYQYSCHSSSSISLNVCNHNIYYFGNETVIVSLISKQMFQTQFNRKWDSLDIKQKIQYQIIHTLRYVQVQYPIFLKNFVHVGKVKIRDNTPSQLSHISSICNTHTIYLIYFLCLSIIQSSI